MQVAKINDGTGPWHTWREVATIGTMTSSGSSSLPFYGREGMPWAPDDPKHPARYCHRHGRAVTPDNECKACDPMGRAAEALAAWRRIDAATREFRTL